jgi:hypothetical protein
MRNSVFFAGQKGKTSVTTSEQAIKPEQKNSDESN